MKTHQMKIKDAVASLNKEVKPTEIIQWIKANYPEEKESLNKETYRADIIGSSINHGSTHHYPRMQKFLWFNESTKSYRMATEDEVKSLEKKEPVKEKEAAVKYYSGKPVIEIGPSGRLVIPSPVMRELGFEAGDSVELNKTEKGEVWMKKGKLQFLPTN